MLNINITEGLPCPMGASITEKGINMVVSVKPGRSLSLHIYGKTDLKIKETVKIPDSFKTGDLYYFTLTGSGLSKLVYNYYDDTEEFTDPYAQRIYGCNKWGTHMTYGVFPDNTDGCFDWEDDRMPRYALEDVIMYCLHVRGFTKHTSSKVKFPGTFEGLTEKLPYLKSLGINQVMLLPSYEFNECIGRAKRPRNVDEAVPEEKLIAKEKINYWGFSDEALYFAPKSAYCASDDSAFSMKSMVKAFHRAGIEVVLQFYFSRSYTTAYILDCLRHWTYEYHIDGFAVLGEKVPEREILNDAILADTKIYMWNIPEECIAIKGGKPIRRNTALLQDGFMADMRKFLKSDGDMLRSFINHQNDNPEKYGIINFISNYYGFTLSDLVSYERKHNEDNGEDNRDGSDYNFSWNCGAEGPSRKRMIVSLRAKQVRNALTFLYMSAGIPMIMAGDEFGNSQKGNNNAYCQDNRITWLDWGQAEKNSELTDFVRSLIALRKNHDMLRQSCPKKLTDVSSCGYPDLSYHSEQAWYPQLENYNRHIGCMYAKKDEKGYDFIFALYNMYWTPKHFALPKLPKGLVWKVCMDTGKGFADGEVLKGQEEYIVPERSSVILVSDGDTL